MDMRWSLGRRLIQLRHCRLDRASSLFEARRGRRSMEGAGRSISRNCARSSLFRMRGHEHSNAMDLRLGRAQACAHSTLNRQQRGQHCRFHRVKRQDAVARFARPPTESHKGRLGGRTRQPRAELQSTWSTGWARLWVRPQAATVTASTHTRGKRFIVPLDLSSGEKFPVAVTALFVVRLEVIGTHMAYQPA